MVDVIIELYNKYSISKRKIKFFQTRLLSWYKNKGRKFYWRKKRLTHYQYIIAEVLLQRTKAETIAKFYHHFISEFPNWNTLAKAEIQILEEYLKPIGLYRQRSHRLSKLAQEMVKRKGRLPKTREELELIPYMGQYIANAVELIIHNNHSPLIDVNMSRLLERFFGKRKMADIRYDPYLQKLSYEVVDHLNAKEINWAILDFAAMQCKPEPRCTLCVLKTHCMYFKQVHVK